MTDLGLDRALGAVARTRATGLHFFGHFLDVSPAPGDKDRLRLVLQPEPVPHPGPVSPVAVATLADLVMGWSIRERLGPGRRLGTTSLSVHHLHKVAPGPITADAAAVRVDDDPEGGLARCEIRDVNGTLVAAVDGWFLAVPPPAGRPLPPVPWETSPAAQPPMTTLASDDLDAQERTAVDEACAAAARAEAHGTSVVEELLALEWVESEGQLSATMRIGPQHSNRVGHVQGGVLYGAAALSAARLVGSNARITAGALQFLRPAEGATLDCRASVLRRGRRAIFCEVRLSTRGSEVAVGQFTAVVPHERG
jgi:acyl-coenzyme A thioesterase PaaI-like protein